MGFEPTTTCLGSKDSTTELRPLAEVNPTLGFLIKSRNALLPHPFHNRELAPPDLEAILPPGLKGEHGSGI